MHKCILWGGYAGGNSGDELTLAVALEEMQDRYCGSVAILSRRPGYTMLQFPGVAVIPYEPVPRARRPSILQRLRRKAEWRSLGRPRWRYRVADQMKAVVRPSWVQHILSSKRVYLVSGGYLTDLFDVESFLLPVSIAKEAGVPVSTAPLGIGPFNSHETAQKVIETLRSSTDSPVRVRDRASLAFCRGYRLPAEPAKDDGFKAARVVGFPAVRTNGGVTLPSVGINLFDQHGGQNPAVTRRWWSELLKVLAHAPVRIQGFCFHTSPFLDLAQTTECFVNAGLDVTVHPPKLDFRRACAELASFDVIVSARFHAVVIGNLLGKVTFGVYDGAYYANKMEAATESFERSSALDPQRVCPGDAGERILAAANKHKQLE